MAMEIEDMGESEQTVVIEGDAINSPRSVTLNRPERDADTGLVYLSNDVQRTRLKVALEDVPTSSSFRAQQLAAMSEAVKALPPAAQQAAMPFMVDLMDLPRKAQFVEAVKKAQEMPDEQQLREQIKQWQAMRPARLADLMRDRSYDATPQELREIADADRKAHV